jgi:hypothetical protein
VLVALLPTVISVILYWAFERYLDFIGETPGLFSAKSAGIKEFWRDAAHGHVGAFKVSLAFLLHLHFYVGLLSLPFLLKVAPRVLLGLTAARRKVVWLLVAGVSQVVTTILASRGWLMPMLKNQLSTYGVGVVTLPGELPGLPRAFWILVTALAVVGAMLLLVILGELARQKWLTRRSAIGHELWHVAFLLAVGLFNFAPNAFAYLLIFERYFVVFLPIFIGLVVALSHRAERTHDRLNGCRRR